ncbi:hypothetical protein KFK09_022049 [Dendrobium nobile]|uniref:Uncharacterized protein n=1 Tax=Dendrobium nobile TaxID=94219 RepID=A0A8T3AGP8_DENNO|nr:hypothetical protein KFK09_022049 [Dendrobium nobile]
MPAQPARIRQNQQKKTTKMKYRSRENENFPQTSESQRDKLPLGRGKLPPPPKPTSSPVAPRGQSFLTQKLLHARKYMIIVDREKLLSSSFVRGTNTHNL